MIRRKSANLHALNTFTMDPGSVNTQPSPQKDPLLLFHSSCVYLKQQDIGKSVVGAAWQVFNRQLTIGFVSKV